MHRSWGARRIGQFETAVEILGKQQGENPGFFRQDTRDVVGGDAQKADGLKTLYDGPRPQPDYHPMKK